MVAKFLSSLTLFIYFFDSGQALCFNTKSQWEAVCNETYHGVADGGRCFFVVNNVTIWDDSWKLCENQGGSLAQIHTKSEFLRIVPYFQIFYSMIGQHTPTNPTWIAMRKDPPDDLLAFLDREKSFWYTNLTDYNPKFKAGNTWVRNHHADDANSGPCYLLWYNGQTVFGDQPCSQLYWPLCVITNSNQNFTLFHNKCIAEEVMETLSTTDAKSCGIKCVSFGWCRGFNFRRDTGTCELFPWSLGSDTDADKPKSTVNANCHAYSYVP